MLRRLSVSNYILIDSLEIEFDPRLNIITGETGAGKSILLGALGLLLGNKNEGAALRDTQRNCVIEGVFDIAAYGLRPFFEANDLDYADEAVVRRILTPAGKSRAYINDLPVQLTQLREFGSRLIDIHSQHQNLILASEEFRTEALDTVAGNGELRAAYRAKYERLQELQRTCARLRAGEVAELEAEQAVLANADRIGEAITAVRNAFDGDEIGVLAQVKNAEVEIGRLGGSYPHAADLSRRLRSVLEELKDIAATLAEDGERIETNPERLQKVDDRLNTLYTLCQKHRAADEGELIALRDRYAAQLDAITHSDEELAALQAEIGAARNEAELLASELHRTREQAAPAFAGQIVATLVRLGMPDARFEAAVVDCGALTEGGRDRVEFRFSANRTTPPAAVERIASGGELSRVMLALKALLARRMQLPTILFDEIDTGVSGRIADAMGEIICALAETMQVVDITHLPQVASKGSTHFVVYKRDGETHIARLTPDERTTEIAKMLSGSEVTEAAMTQARILLGGK